MPWEEATKLDRRHQFIAAYLQQEVSLAALCRDFGISRTVGYKWIDRFQADGWDGLHCRSRAPLHPRQAAIG